MKQEQLGYVDALKFLAKKYGIEIEDRELTPEERRSQNERESMFAVNEWASHYFHNTLLNSEEGQTVGLAYCRNRGFRDDIIARFRLGFSPSAYDAMSSSALAEGYNQDYLVKTGLSVQRDNGSLYDKYHGRVIFPWFGISGKIVGFGGRVLDARTKGVNQKYINSAESEIYHKASELYGLYQAKKAISKEHNVFMVEGYTDVISMHQCGIENVVANSGTALSEAQITLLQRFTKNITLLYDGDAAGQKAALRGTDMLLARGMRIKILLLPDGDDPDSFARKHNATEFREYVESHQVDFITFKTNLLKQQAANDPDRMSDLIRSIVESIAVVPEEIERSVYIHRCSEMLRVDEGMLIREVMRTCERNSEQRLREKENLENRQRMLGQQSQGGASGSQPSDADGGASGAEGATSDADGLSSGSDGQPTGAAVSAQGGALSQDKNRQMPPSRIEALESLLMRQIVRYGSQMMQAGAEDADSTVTVTDYIASELQAMGIAFSTPLYRNMLDALTAARGSAVAPAHFFLNSPQVEFSQEASRLLSDEYMLSTRDAKEEEGLYAEQTVHLMVDYKMLMVSNEIERVMAQLNDPSVRNDAVRLMELMRKQMQLTQMKQELTRQLGRNR